MIRRVIEQLLLKLIIYFSDRLVFWFDWMLKKIKKKHAQMVAKKEYEAIKADPNATPDEIGKAYEKMVNAGK